MKPLQSHGPAYDVDALLLAFSEKQFLRPHLPLSQALVELAVRLGYCGSIAARAAAWLELDPATPIGRLRRSELSQLARSIHRFWRQTLHRSVADPSTHAAAIAVSADA